MVEQLILALAAVLPTAAAAQASSQVPPVILKEIDVGPAVPVSPYVSYLIAGTDQAGVLAGVKFPLVSRLQPALLMKAETQVLERKWVTAPVFLVGTDQRSQDWLLQSADALAGMGAVGLILDAPDEQAFKQMQALAEEMQLSIAPGPDRWLETQLLSKGTGVLPLLIGFDGRARQEVSVP